MTEHTISPYLENFRIEYATHTGKLIVDSD